MNERPATISVVTPTLRRCEEVVGLLENLAEQTHLPLELVLVDGAPEGETETEIAVKAMIDRMPYRVVYIRHGGGTAIQRNVGIDAAAGDSISFIDDDIRLDPGFFERMAEAFAEDGNADVGGIAGYITNQYFDQNSTPRWIHARPLRLPNRHSVNRYMQPPHNELRTLDFMGSSCAVWRREVFRDGLRFSEFFTDYGVLEDAHFALRAAKKWRLLENGRAHCTHLRSPKSRVNRRRLGYKCVVNYYFVFQDIASPLSLNNKFRFWRFQSFEVFRVAAFAARNRSWGDVQDVRGRFEGMWAVFRGVTKTRPEPEPFRQAA